RRPTVHPPRVHEAHRPEEGRARPGGPLPPRDVDHARAPAHLPRPKDLQGPQPDVRSLPGQRRLPEGRRGEEEVIADAWGSRPAPGRYDNGVTTSQEAPPWIDAIF